MAIKNVKLKSGDDVLYPKTKISNILNEDGTTWEEKVVEANPSENSTADLTKVKIGNIVYKMASQVEANPSGEATTDLTKLKIADTIYKLASGSSGSSGGSGKLELLKPTLNYDTSNSMVEQISGTLTAEEATKVFNGQVYGLLVANERYSGLCTYYAQEGASNERIAYFICYTLLSDIMSAMGEGESAISGVLLLAVVGNNIVGYFIKSLNTALIPPLPSDSSNKTYVLKSVNGKLTWSE